MGRACTHARRWLPSNIYSTGGRFGYRDQGQTPNTQLVSYRFDDGTEFETEIRGRYTNREGAARDTCLSACRPLRGFPCQIACDGAPAGGELACGVGSVALPRQFLTGGDPDPVPFLR